MPKVKDSSVTTLARTSNGDSALELVLPAAILWDMDGTLIDSEPFWQAAEMELVTSGGGVWSLEQALELVGSDLHAAAHVLIAAGAPMDVAGVVDYLVTTVAHKISQGVPWRKHAPETLAWVKDLGIPCALVTMSHAPIAQGLLDAVDTGTFDVVVTGDMVEKGKPDPLPYLRAAELLGVEISNCVAVEDSVTGITSALASGAKTLGIEAVSPIQPLQGLSRITSLEQITPSALDVLMRGGTVDFYTA